MNPELSEPGDVSTVTQSNQLSLAGLFLITTAVALVLGYAAKFGQESMVLAFIYAGWVLLFSIVVGFIGRDWKNAFFWGSLYALLAFLAVAGARIPHPAVSVGWGAVGALVGGCAGIGFPKNFVAACLASCLLGWAAMSSVVLGMGQSLTGAVGFDTLCAALVGGLLKPFTSVLQWVERNGRHPRVVLASWLSISVIVGNSLVPILVGVQR